MLCNRQTSARAFVSYAVGLVLFALGILVAPMTHVSAQGDPSSALSSLLPQHRIELLPHRIVLNEHTRSATFTITNHANKPTAAEVRVEFAYSVWPHGLPY